MADWFFTCSQQSGYALHLHSYIWLTLLFKATCIQGMKKKNLAIWSYKLIIYIKNGQNEILYSSEKSATRYQSLKQSKHPFKMNKSLPNIKEHPITKWVLGKTWSLSTTPRMKECRTGLCLRAWDHSSSNKHSMHHTIFNARHPSGHSVWADIP